MDIEAALALPLKGAGRLVRKDRPVIIARIADDILRNLSDLFRRRDDKSMRVALMVPELNLRGDAVGNDVAGMYRALSDHPMGKVRIFAHTATGGAGSVAPYEEAASWLREEDIAIYHYATVDEKALDVLSKLRCRVIIRYHNITPEHYFQGISPEYEHAVAEGRRLLGAFLRLPKCCAMPASEYNARELISLGLDRGRNCIVPPLHCVEELLAQRTTVDLDRRGGAFEILAVGRVAPNKRVDLLLNCVADVIEKGRFPVNLTIVGSSDVRLARYRQQIDSVIADRRSLHGQVRFLERVSMTELAECYERSDLFLTCSAHEGFCVPVIEAMAFSRPVVSSSQSALMETCGAAATICDDRADYVSAILRLMGSSADRKALAAFGKQRYERVFSNAVVTRKFLEALIVLSRHKTG